MTSGFIYSSCDTALADQGSCFSNVGSKPTLRIELNSYDVFRVSYQQTFRKIHLNRKENEITVCEMVKVNEDIALNVEKINFRQIAVMDMWRQECQETAVCVSSSCLCQLVLLRESTEELWGLRGGRERERESKRANIEKVITTF